MKSRITEETLANMRDWRHTLHAMPELAYHETKTADFIAARLIEMGLRVERGLAGTGVVGILEGKGTSDRAIGLRCELDALPIEEANGFGHVSRHDGRMHACGHDGHMAMVLGAADHLSRNRDFTGKVVFVFQPAEENEGGGRRMVDAGLFEQYPVQSIYAVHNWPGLAEGRIAVQPGPMMARFDTFDFIVRGQGGHAALPHHLQDPTVAAGHLIAAIQTVVARNIDPFEQGVVSVTFMNGGQVHNVVPDVITVGGTVRTFDDAVQDRIESRLKAIASGLGAALDVSIELVYDRRMPTTINTVREAELAQRAAQAAFGAGTVDTQFRPSMGSEDFSVMLQNRPGAYAWIGAGPLVSGTGLHQASYDFNDRILGIGAAYYDAIVSEELGG
ncbi:MAG TPA: M20 aminoacylase family protein [Aliidongia sp.]|uniref:M20 aminoacylase family protein n=1 Tax=Aliidongia sp. TaxID=1914230 RepID=UPI002DDD6850|nr:M20 aminoacylase family protein [Aliidongia sp.]HEV2678305.1 M20 aminoacylase family protein [Aliidongia sp.]